MKIAVDRVKVDEAERIRTEVGNLKPLEESIAKVGLINPLVVDEDENLVAGYRRLQACKNLGFQEVEVVVVDFDGDPLKKLDVEVAENFFRKDFTPEEILSTEVKRREIIESRRKKGFFERLWLWLKSLFTSSSPKEKAGEKKKMDGARSTVEAPASEVVAKSDDRSKKQDQEQQAAAKNDESSREQDRERQAPVKDDGGSGEQDQEQQTAAKDDESSREQDRERQAPAKEKETKSRKDRSGEPAATASKQYRQAGGDRSIKWRTS